MNFVYKQLKRVGIGLAIPAILLAITILVDPSKISGTTFVNILTQAIPSALLAWGIAFNIKVGLWDFSVGAVVLFSGIMGGSIAQALNLGVVGVIVLCSLIGLLNGLITGTLFAILKIPSIVVSVGMMLILESISALVFGGQGVMLSSEILVLGRFPANIIVAVVAFLIAYYLYNYNKFGFHVRAIGSGIKVAQMNGIKIAKIRTICFMIAGLFAGFFAFMKLGSTSIIRLVSNMGTMGVVFDAIICAFIAMALQRSVNLIVGIFIGSITAQIIKTLILNSGFPSMFQQVVIALFLLVFMGLSERGQDLIKMIKKSFGGKAKMLQ